jgi:hypothetical protein
MNLAVYAIAKNERQHIDRFLASVDHPAVRQIVIVDTGSTDGTQDYLRALVESNAWRGKLWYYIKEFTPWHFGDARQYALEQVLDDIDFALVMDLDEVMAQGWVEALESAVTLDTTRFTYTLVSSHKDDGSPALTLPRNLCHKPALYEWKGRVHEALMPKAGVADVQTPVTMECHHWPDKAKSREQYLELLEMAVQDTPRDPRPRFYLGREYWYKNRFDDARTTLQEYLRMPECWWGTERSEAYRLLAAMAPTNEQKVAYLRHATAECPERRDPWVDLAQQHYERGEWAHCYAAAEAALTITDRASAFMSSDYCWHWLPYDLSAIAAYRLGLKDVALRRGTEALHLSDKAQTKRLTENLVWYERML